MGIGTDNYFYTKLVYKATSHKSYVGFEGKYDQMAATQFALLTFLGLRSTHKLLDFGCGSLRAGRLLIPYLDVSNYYCIEPNSDLINRGLNSDLGESILSTKKPHFDNNQNFDIGIFNVAFDFILAQSIFSHTGKDLTLHILRGIHTSRTQTRISPLQLLPLYLMK